MHLIFLFLLSISCAFGNIVPRPKDGAEEEDTFMEPLDILKKYGYPAENHTVHTEDGYILTLFRIPYGRLCSAEKSRGPVILQHGLMSSGVDWYIAGTEKGLAYILADNCYDVWLGNSRGNTYSKRHEYLDVHSDEYWDFSWHEMGKYDVPAVVDYILDTTGRKDVMYIGHSQGTTEFFVFNSLHPEYAEKVKAAFMLAPIAFLGHSKSTLLNVLAKFANQIDWVLEMLGINEFFPQNDLITIAGGAFCKETHPTLAALCDTGLFLICGWDSQQMNNTLMPIMLGHLPAGAATKQLLHYAQLINSGKFRQFDFGDKDKNLDKYGQEEPPDYDLTQGNIPIFLHYSRNDLLAQIEDVDILAEQLPNLEAKVLVPFDKFNHFDYIIAVDAPTLVYDRLIDLMNRF